MKLINITHYKFRFAIWLAAVFLMLTATLAAQEKIAFETTRDGNSEIYVMNSDGSAQTRLTNSTGEDFDPAFSPDGSRIAFVSSRDGNSEIYVMNADGTQQTRLTMTTTAG